MKRQTRHSINGYRLVAIAMLGIGAVAQAQPEVEPPDQSLKSINDSSAINQLESQDGPRVESAYAGSSELTGVLVDRTLTVIGQNFYRAFSQIGMGHPIIRGATLTIHERPDARWGIQLWITDGPRVYFDTRLSPRLSEADEVARQAIDLVEKAILKRELEAALNPSADLGKEEL